MHLSHQPRRHPLASTERAQHERGYVMVTFALLLVPLLLMVGLSVDVGGWYNRSSDIQKAADAAALAGVVWLPDVAKATTYAKEAAKRNGYEDGVNNISVTVAQISDRRLRVTIKDAKVNSFFYQKIGGSTIDLSRKGTAEYVLPVPLGSPENRLGNDPTASPAYTPNLWASISAPYTDRANGDPYSTKCANGTSGTSCGNGNIEYRNYGYLYIVDVPASAVGQTLKVEVYDAGHYARSNYPNVETADNGTVNTQFELFSPDDTPLNTLDGLTSSYSQEGDCSAGPGRLYLASGASATTYQNKWATLCQVNVTKAGQWVLQVKSSNISGVTDSGSGWNQFSLRSSLSGSVQPQLYTVGDLSLFNNLPGQTGNINSTFYLAKIESQHAGKTLQVSLFDPGDGLSGTYYVNLLGPGGTTQACNYGERGTTKVALSNCRIQTRTSAGVNTYNGKWLDIDIVLPNNYSCTTDCWWKVKYEFVGVTSGNSPNDRTVWAARVIGDPVHLIEE
ncbi:hypothetical protein KSP35_07950 [Aquihabitans sp. G128]|uniref:pilus assembly protein TadG-related protein n=1 Tax=Aquihabitans sp. G128 TaxID=2849779 RepID=UPI001C2176E3|nr:pilus assembly protein TadG-related protein [Aquihabitans sp. G128]QXC62713.1 hypothetical protein KSP35_07950 [Aquihabitans sp. G128]